MIDRSPTLARPQPINISIHHLRLTTLGTRGYTMEQAERVVVVQIDTTLDITWNRGPMHGVDHDNQLDRYAMAL